MNSEWKKSSRSGANQGSCVEVRLVAGAVDVRDSKDRGGPTLTFPANSWTAFVDAIKRDDADR